MSEAAVSQAPVAPADPARKAQVEGMLGDVLRLMEYPARLELKDMPDGGIGVAVHFVGELPGITPGKKSPLVDCLQFIINKAVNRPNVERRWVSLGVDGFPEPRPPPAPPQAKPNAPKAAAPAAAPQAKAPNKPAPGAPAQPKPSHPHRGQPDEAQLDVPADPQLTAVAKALAAKANALGRAYAVMMLSPEDRARVLKAAAGSPGVHVRAEGEGHWRRVAYQPHKPAPLPKKTAVMPDYDDEEE